MTLAQLVENLRAAKAREDRARDTATDSIYDHACRDTDQAQAALNRARKEGERHNLVQSR